MKEDCTGFAQLLDFVPKYEFDKRVTRYHAITTSANLCGLRPASGARLRCFTAKPVWVCYLPVATWEIAHQTRRAALI